MNEFVRKLRQNTMKAFLAVVVLAICGTLCSTNAQAAESLSGKLSDNKTVYDNLNIESDLDLNAIYSM